METSDAHAGLTSACATLAERVRGGAVAVPSEDFWMAVVVMTLDNAVGLSGLTPQTWYQTTRALDTATGAILKMRLADKAKGATSDEELAKLRAQFEAADTHEETD